MRTSIMTAAALSAALLGALLGATAQAALPAPTPAQQQAAATKKAAADAQAAKDKESLAASMDAVSARWRANAAAQGKKVNPPVAIAAAGSATPPKTSPAALAAMMPSEKHGTAPPSKDVKAGPTRAEPVGTPPTVDKGTPDVKNK